MINLKIDDKEISVPEGVTILEAARQANIDIPTLCYLKGINQIGDCRMCIVEVEGRKGFATSCIQKVEESRTFLLYFQCVLSSQTALIIKTLVQRYAFLRT